jgi:hypothetical protein
LPISSIQEPPATVLAWISHTIVDVLLAEMTGESDWTTAFVSVDYIETLFAIDTLDGETFVNVVLAVHSLES